MRLDSVVKGRISDVEATGREVLSLRDVRVKVAWIGAVLPLVALGLLHVPNIPDEILVDSFFGSIVVFVGSMGFLLPLRIRGNRLRHYEINLVGKRGTSGKPLITYTDGSRIRQEVEVRRVRPFFGTPLFVKAGQASVAIRGLNSSMTIEISSPAYNLYLGFKNDAEMRQAYEAVTS